MSIESSSIKADTMRLCFYEVFLSINSIHFYSDNVIALVHK